MRDASPFAKLSLLVIVVLLGMIAMRSSSVPQAAAADTPDAAAERLKATSLSQLQVSGGAGGLTVFDAATGDVFLVPTPYNEKAPITPLGTLRKKDGWTGKWEFASPQTGAPAADAGKVEAARKSIATATSDLAAISLALDLFEVDTGRYPKTEEGLQALVVQPPGVEMWKGPYLKRGLPKDPWGNPYIYRYPGKDGPNRFDLSSFGPNGTDGGGDDIVSGSK